MAYIKSINDVREMVTSLPNEKLKNEFIELLKEERSDSIWTYEDLEEFFIFENFDELLKIGWLTEC